MKLALPTDGQLLEMDCHSGSDCATVRTVELDIQCVAIDAAEPRTLAAFWEQALGWRRTHDTDQGVVLEPPERSIGDGVVPDLLFNQVPEEKSVKNRLHLDLRPGDQETEVARLEALGATRVDVGQPDSVRWVAMRDPEGNEFCVLPPLTPEQGAELERIRRARRSA